MRLTPLDIREQHFRRVMRGLDPDEVETFLATVAGEFEALLADNNSLRQRVVELEEKIVEYRSMEKALRDTLLTAEKVMGEAKEGAQREAGLIIREAEMSAQRAKARLTHELADLQREVSELRRMKDAYTSRVRWLLRAHLEMLDGHAQEFAEIDAGLDPSGAPGPPPGATPPAAARPGRPADGAFTMEDLADVLRPIGPDGSYAPGPAPAPGEPASRPGTPPAPPHTHEGPGPRS